jgi:hypothetical protein
MDNIFVVGKRTAFPLSLCIRGKMPNVLYNNMIIGPIIFNVFGSSKLGDLSVLQKWAEKIGTLRH